ncbi:MAG: hypothetical protein JW748_04645 [Anaerolineales bacterium]|nr:hypothetical protein [Anaerolineales bacterium]
MKKSFPNRIVASTIMACLLVGCALPMASTPTQFVFPTPNLTMTALFQIPPTNTVAPQATATQAVPTSSTPSATLSPTAPNCTNLAQFVSETFPDLTYIAPGTAFTKTWTLKNAGTCTWGAGYALVFDSGDQMGGPASVPMTASVPPGAVYNFTVNLKAPATLGQYQGFWKLQSPQGVRFGTDASGKAFWVKITTAVLAPACAAQTKRPESYGGIIEAYYTSTPPTIDAVLTDWDSPLIDDVPYDVWGDTDNDARFTLKWDHDNLYLAVKVVDDNFYQSTSGGEDLFKGDSVEILLDKDLKGDYCSTVMSSDDYQVGISPGDLIGTQGPSVWMWYPLDKKGYKIVAIASVMTIAPDTNGYIIEAAIPWSTFGGAPAGSEYYGFALSVSDNDESGQQQQGMISTAPKRTIFSNPMLWGTLQIEIQTGP